MGRIVWKGRDYRMGDGRRGREKRNGWERRGREEGREQKRKKKGKERRKGEKERRRGRTEEYSIIYNNSNTIRQTPNLNLEHQHETEFSSEHQYPFTSTKHPTRSNINKWIQMPTRIE